jgi:outer membrane protein assembly factor BamD
MFPMVGARWRASHPARRAKAEECGAHRDVPQRFTSLGNFQEDFPPVFTANLGEGIREGIIKGEAGMKRTIIFTIFLFVSSGFMLSGCSLLSSFTSKQKNETTPEGIYNNALLLYKKKNYDKATKEFRRFKEEFPLSDLVPAAELRLGDCLFYDKKYLEAFIQYEEFKKLHPIHPEIPYATYQMAMCHFKQILTVDRDQAQTLKSIELFRFVSENYPQSSYAEEARGKISICQRQMADHEFYIGNFYLKKKKYRAALNRFEGIMQKYPNSGLETKLQKAIRICRTEIAKAEKSRQALTNPADQRKWAGESEWGRRNVISLRKMEKTTQINS